MPGSTPNYAIPYPVGTDAPNVATDMQALATKVDSSIPLPNVPNGYVRLNASGDLILSNTQKFGWADIPIYRDPSGNTLRMDADVRVYAYDGTASDILLTDEGAWPYLSLRWDSTQNGGAGIEFFNNPAKTKGWGLYSQDADAAPGYLRIYAIANNHDYFRFGSNGIEFSDAAQGGAGNTWDTFFGRVATKTLQVGKGGQPTALGITADNTVWPFYIYDVAAASQPKFHMGINGDMNWGTGAVASDTNLYRIAANYLATDGGFASRGGTGFVYAPASVTGAVVTSQVSGESYARFGVDVNGYTQWGPGNAAQDTKLYRAAAGSLQTDGTFEAGVLRALTYGIFNDNGTAPVVGVGYDFNGHQFCGIGFTYDTSLYRYAAQILQTNARIIASGDGSFAFHAEVPTSGGAYQPFYYRVLGDSQPRWAVMYDGTIQWGTGGSTAPDTTLARRAPNCLITSGELWTTQRVFINESRTGGYSAIMVQNMASDGYYFAMKRASDTTNVWIMGADGRMVWSAGGGSAQDTNLYRGGAGLLITDGQFQASGGITNASLPPQLKQYAAYEPSDMNNSQTSGWYYANSIANQPPSSTSQWLYQVIMWGSNGYGKQIAYGLYSNEVWTRYLYSSTWNPWAQVGGVPTGAGADWFGATAPTGFLLCDGSAISRTTYSALYAILGTAYGAGDGSTTFNLPDLRGRVIVGMASGGHASVNALGLNDGAALANRTPKHSHTNGLTLPTHAHAHSLTLPNHYHNVSDPGHGHSVQSWQYSTAGGGYSMGYSTSASGSYSVSPVGMINNNGTGIAVYDVTQGALAINGGVGNNSSSPAIAGTIGVAVGGTDSPSYVTANKIIKT